MEVKTLDMWVSKVQVGSSQSQKCRKSLEVLYKDFSREHRAGENGFGIDGVKSHDLIVRIMFTNEE